ncbi:MAG: DUF2961 domain-containing protein [Candidatus Hydrogenedentes bacterium]|nr:DUF2961 domain-containing protein [Candidatus Hydrogenedentota bacterium]
MPKRTATKIFLLVTLAGLAQADQGANDPLGIARLRDDTTRQLTTFNLETRNKVIDVPRGKAVTVGEVKGNGYIANLWLTFPGWFWQHWNPSAPINPTILKTLILRIYWDGSDKPAVEAPMGDFFGIGLCEVKSFASQYFGMSSGGFYCKFPMPFRKGFKIEIENRDDAIDTIVFMNVLYQLTGNIPKDAGYFHAQFHTGKNEGPNPVHIAEWTARGQYVGCTLSMQGEERNYLSFLEAPEYIYIDDDWEKPRITGTGLEDYFLGGWYFREAEFAGPLHGVPVKDALTASVAMYRAHDADAIHFRERFKMDFVNPWAPERLKPFVYSSVAFAYLNTPEGQNPPTPSANELLCWYRLRDRDHQSIP